QAATSSDLTHTSFRSTDLGFRDLMAENKGAAAAVPEKEAPASSYFKKTVELAKDQYRQLKAPAKEHWASMKSKVSSMLSEPFFGGSKADSSSNTPPSVESQ
uniref:Uncharacterized protein n=1 Tax=Aegilops tauschii subsp. strangulata TaxID=200361 RepID=A0A453SXR0_AEGTS